MNRYDDEHYRQWPHPISEEDIKADGLLKSMTAAEELSTFLTIRGMCLREAGRLPEAVAAHAAAHRLVPDWRGNQVLLADAQERLAGMPAALLQREPAFSSHQEEVDFIVRRVEAINRLKRAELGIPDSRPPLPNPFSKPP